MKTLKQVNIKNCPSYFFNSMTNIKNLDTNLLGINQITFTNTDSVVYDTEYFKNSDGVILCILFLMLILSALMKINT